MYDKWKKEYSKYGDKVPHYISEIFAHKWSQYSGDRTMQIGYYEGLVRSALKNPNLQFKTNY